MPQDHQFALLAPLLVCAIGVAATVLVHALAVFAILNLMRREQRRGRAGAGTFIDLAIVAQAIVFAFAAHLVEIALWAVLLLAVGEFHGYADAFYQSAVNYTSLGYGDVLMTPAWRLLGPLETANGMLMFGVSAAMVFAVMQRLIRAHYTDLNS